MLHNPVHLLGVEAVASVVAAARGQFLRPRCAAAVRRLWRKPIATIAAGEVLAHRRAARDRAARSADPAGGAARTGTARAVLFAAGHRVRRPVARGAVLTTDDVELDAGGARHRLRRAQDAAFASVESTPCLALHEVRHLIAG